MSDGLTAVDANRLFYAETAITYEETEDCLRSARQQARLELAIREAIDRLGKAPRVLDACGGTGNVGMALQKYKITPVVVDVSPEMLSIWEAKAEALGLLAEVHLVPIDKFFKADARCWDLVTFSSALHHLEDYESVLLAAADKLKPGGLLLTIFDPVQATTGARLVRRIDFVAWLLLTNPPQFMSLLLAKIRRATRPDQGSAHIGRMAERYAYEGINDEQLVATARRHGLEVVVHQRYCDARLAPLRVLLKRLNRPSNFRLLLRRQT